MPETDEFLPSDQTPDIELESALHDLEPGELEDEEIEDETMDEDSLDDPDPMELLIRERDEYKDLYARQLAEFQTYRRRTMQEREELRKVATENLVSDLLPVLDNFERTLQAASSGATLESLVEGVQMVERQLRSALTAVGLERIPAAGQPFDPAVHEALGTDPAGDVAPETVTVEIQAGYRLGEKVIRPARVRVAQ